MNVLELGIVLICYSFAAWRDYTAGNLPMSWVWACYAASLLGFMAMRAK